MTNQNSAKFTVLIAFVMLSFYGIAENQHRPSADAGDNKFAIPNT